MSLKGSHESALDSFVKGQSHAAGPPSVFYVNLTEMCQLACAHCITDAPATTASGRARALSPEVLKALTPHLAHAEYVGFTHSGEPLISPALIPFLQALRAQRGGTPTVVHVVTNGMALTEARFIELVGLGISSWSFSLDGVTPATNDALRVGARIEQLMPRITALSELRHRSFPHVRMGVSCTVTKSNLHELEAMARFVATAQLDCVKFEETFPLNERAKIEAAIEPRALRQHVDNALTTAHSLGLHAVDHTRGYEVWKCNPPIVTPEIERFGRADDFANRLDINPCRRPWQVVCVEPDGALKPDNFHQPSAGNILQTDLVSIWNSPHFMARRQASVARRRCQIVSCVKADSGLVPTKIGS